jgi:Siphovirus Gp157
MGQAKVAQPMGTISRTKPRLSLRIVSEADIPSQLCKSVPDSAAIKAQLEAGETVPGAVLEAGEASITVRVK